MRLPVILTSLVLVAAVSGCVIQKEVPCSKLPSAEEVMKIIEENNEAVERVEKYTAFEIQIDSARCPGKADIIIYYATEKDRQKIVEEIGADFLGIPYRMFNV